MTFRNNETFESFIRKMELTPELEQTIETLIEERTFKRGDTITSEGDLRNYIFYIAKGSSRVYYIRSGKEHTYSFALEEEFITLARPLIADSNNVTTIEFLEPTVIYMLPLHKTHTLLRQYDFSTIAQIINGIFKGLSKHICDLEERILMLQTLSAKDRYNWLASRYPKILERANMNQIASYIGVTKETLYRIRAGKY